MNINHLSASVSFIRPMINQVVGKQDRLKKTIACLAVAILLGMAIYWAYDLFWKKRQVEQVKFPNINICIIAALQAGCVGKDPSKIPNINQFTLEDGNPIPLNNEDDLLLPLHVLNPPYELGLPQTIYLPEKLFSGKRDGDSLRINFKNQLIEFTINQADHGPRFEQGTFQEVLDLTHHVCKEKVEDHIPLFGIFDPHHWYRLDGGTVYKLLNQGAGQFKLQSVPPEDFKPLQRKAVILDPNLPEDHEQNLRNKENPANILEILQMNVGDQPDGKHFRLGLPGFSPNSPLDQNSIQLFLNDRYLGIHVLREAHVQQKVLGIEIINIPKKPIELVKGIKWKEQYKETTYPMMQNKLSQAKLTLQNGVLEIFLPNEAII